MDAGLSIPNAMPARPQDPLSPRALELVTLLSASPARPSAIAKKIGVHVTTVCYHLHRLEKSGAVVRVGTAWTTPGQPQHGGRDAQALGPSARSILETLEARGPMTPSEVASFRGVSLAAVSATVARLQRSGWVVVAREGRRKHIHLAEGARPGVR